MAVKNISDDEIIAIAQVINKNPAVNFGCFSQEDEKVRMKYQELLAYYFSTYNTI